MQLVTKFTLLLVGITFFSCDKPKEGIKPQYRDLTMAVYSTATVEPRSMYEVYPAVSGILQNVNIEEGDEVVKGASLFTIKNEQSRLSLENANLKYRMVKTNLEGQNAVIKELTESLVAAEKKLRFDSLDYHRQLSLWNQDIGSKQQLDNKKLAYDLARSNVKQLRTSIQRKEEELGQELNIAENNIRLSQTQQSDFTVRSKIAGRVYQLFKEEGESVNPQSPVAVIGSTNDFILSLLIDEVDIASVQLGQQVVVALDAFPQESFDAKVAKIYPTKDERSQTFTIEAEFIEHPKTLLNGMSGEANIVLETKKSVLTVPSQYVVDNKVLVEEGDLAIETGIRSLKYIEIISGIDSSTQIFIKE